MEERMKKQMVENMQRSLKKKKEALTYGVKSQSLNRKISKQGTSKTSKKSLDQKKEERNNQLDSITAGLNRLMKRSVKSRSQIEESLDNIVVRTGIEEDSIDFTKKEQPEFAQTAEIMEKSIFLF